MKKARSLRIISFLLVFVLCICSFQCCIFALTYVEIDDELIKALQSVEFVKDDFGLENVDFSKFTIASPITVYDYTAQGFVETFLYHPLKIDGILTAFAIEIVDGEEKIYQITVELVDELKQNLSNDTDFALVYDRSGCYAYNGETFILIKNSDELILERSQLTDLAMPLAVGLQLENMSGAVALGYESAVYARSDPRLYYMCPVPVIPQEYDNICWAACVASIRNYKQGCNLSAEEVARYYFGNDFNHPQNGYFIANILNESGLSYTFENYIADDNTLLYNLQNDNPVIGVFGGDHVCVIYLYHILSGYIYIMNPKGLQGEDGTRIYAYQVTYLESHNTYSYVSNGYYRDYVAAICTTWHN